MSAYEARVEGRGVSRTLCWSTGKSSFSLLICNRSPRARVSLAPSGSIGDARTHRLLELFDGGIARNRDRELEVARTLDVERELLCCCLFCHVAASLLRCVWNGMTESSASRGGHRATSSASPQAPGKATCSTGISDISNRRLARLDY